MIHLFGDFVFPWKALLRSWTWKYFLGEFLYKKRVNIGHFFYKCLRPLDAHEIFRKEKRLFYFRIRTIFSRITPSIGPTFFTKLASIQYKLHTQLMFPYLNIFWKMFQNSDCDLKLTEMLHIPKARPCHFILILSWFYPNFIQIKSG
mgnify:CR=1 FL=1